MSAVRGRILCVAGEESGDRLLAPIVRGLVDRGFEPVGVGGQACVAAGLQCVTAFDGLAGGGFIDALGTLPRAIAAFRRLSATLERCDGAVLVDFPEVNTRLLQRASVLRRPVFYLGPPQAWAWRPWRAKTMQLATEVGCLFEFEAAWYRARGVAAHWVGHPLGAAAPMPILTNETGLLPGSRAPRAKRLLRVMLAAVERRGERRVHLGLAPSLSPSDVAPILDGTSVEVEIHAGAQSALAACGRVLVGAGTATLDAATARRPMVILGRVHPVSAFLARRWIGTPYFGLPNLILGVEAFPECVQSDCTPERVAEGLSALEDRAWSSVFDRLGEALGGRAWREQLEARLDAFIQHFGV